MSNKIVDGVVRYSYEDMDSMYGQPIAFWITVLYFEMKSKYDA